MLRFLPRHLLNRSTAVASTRNHCSRFFRICSEFWWANRGDGRGPLREDQDVLGFESPRPGRPPPWTIIPGGRLVWGKEQQRPVEPVREMGIAEDRMTSRLVRTTGRGELRTSNFLSKRAVSTIEISCQHRNYQLHSSFMRFRRIESRL